VALCGCLPGDQTATGRIGAWAERSAAAVEVTESYVSLLLTRKKLPPEPRRTDIYDKMGKFLKLPSGELAKLADHQRREVLKRNLDDPALLYCVALPDMWFWVDFTSPVSAFYKRGCQEKHFSRDWNTQRELVSPSSPSHGVRVCDFPFPAVHLAVVTTPFGF